MNFMNKIWFNPTSICIDNWIGALRRFNTLNLTHVIMILILRQRIQGICQNIEGKQRWKITRRGQLKNCRSSCSFTGL